MGINRIPATGKAHICRVMTVAVAVAVVVVPFHVDMLLVAVERFHASAHFDAKKNVLEPANRTLCRMMYIKIPRAEKKVMRPKRFVFI